MSTSENKMKKAPRKKKFALGALIAVLIIASTPFGLNIINAQTSTVLSLSPSVVPTQSLSIGDTFNLTLHLEDVSDLGAWSTSLSWNPTVLNMTGATEEPFLKNGGAFTTLMTPVAPDNMVGFLDEVSCAIFGDGGVDGSGDLAILTFKVVGYGHSDIVMNSSLIDYEYVQYETGKALEHFPISHTSVDASFDLSDPNGTSPSTATSNPHGPEAIFSPANGTTVFKGDLITLDASSSKAGYDTEGANETCPITNYVWLVQYENGTLFSSYSGKIASFTIDELVTLRILLTVTAPDPTSPSNTAFTTTDTASAVIIVEDPGEAEIDLFTNKGGAGDTFNITSFGPRELINAHALVTFDGVPVENQDVAFSLISPNGTITGVRAVRTNSTGYASADFRLPWPGPNPAAVFGTWVISATVDLFQRPINDTVRFIYDYYVTTEFIQLPAYAARSSSIPINVTLNTNTDLLEWSMITITIYDVVEVPVGFFKIEKTNQQKGDTIITTSITIPDWAFVGQATVFVNVLTDLPGDGGVPYCEEVSTNFLIQP